MGKLRGIGVLLPKGYRMYLNPEKPDWSKIDFTQELNDQGDLLHGIEMPVKTYDVDAVLTKIYCLVPGLMLIQGVYTLRFSVIYPKEPPALNVWFLSMDVWDPTVLASAAEVHYEFALRGFLDEDLFDQLKATALSAAIAL